MYVGSGRSGSAQEVEMTAWAGQMQTGRSANLSHKAIGRVLEAARGTNHAQSAQRTRGGEQAGSKHAADVGGKVRRTNLWGEP